MKRENYISWDDYFMGIAKLSGMRSKDPATQVGACVVDKDNRIISIGYNGFVNGCSDDDFPWGKEGDFLETKYPFVVHAEANAILNARGKSMEGCKIYVTLFPCNECAKSIVQAGIKEVIYLSDKNANKDTAKASRLIFNTVGIKLTKFVPNVKNININF